jgi:arginyl-tRNA synthetase
MNFFNYITDIVNKELKELSASGTLPTGLEFKNVTVEPPRDSSHGDVATNAAMVLAKQAKMKPRDIADALAARLREIADIETVEVAGPGFINMRLATSFWHARLAEVLAAGTDYGTSSVGAGEKVNVEYVSANPTGPMHVGHARGAVVGDAVASLLQKAGYDVTREYYINDSGSQIDVLAKSLHLRYREALGEDIGAIPEGLYPGDYLVPVGQKLAENNADKWLKVPESEWLPVFHLEAINPMMDMIRDDLAALGIVHDVFTSERKLVADGEVDAAFEQLESQGLIYQGVLEPPKGRKPDDWEERPQDLFRASDFGDDTDRPLKKSDGSWTYFASDISYHLNKYRRGFANQIDIWGVDHGGYVKRMKAAVKAISGSKADLDVMLCSLVKLTRDGEPVKMSKRSGDFVTLREVVDEVGLDVVRFIMLTRRNDAPLDFDFAQVTEQSRDNPVFYVQYAHARARSVRRNALESVSADILGNIADTELAKTDCSALTDPDEIALIRLMASWPRIVETAAAAHEPHRIAFYLHEVASAFHSLWNKGKEDVTLRFIIEDDIGLTRARLALIGGAASVISAGLAVMGVKALEELR